MSQTGRQAYVLAESSRTTNARRGLCEFISPPPDLETSGEERANKNVRRLYGLTKYTTFPRPEFTGVIAAIKQPLPHRSLSKLIRERPKQLVLVCFLLSYLLF